jgi:hypothetical protein
MVESTIISTSHTPGRRIVVSVATVIQEGTMILRAEVVLSWIGQKTMVVVTSPLTGTIQRMVPMVPVTEEREACHPRSMGARCILGMVQVWTSPLVAIITMAMARHMQ